MTRVASSNFTNGDEAFDVITASGGVYGAVQNYDVPRLTQALENHTHASGRGAAVTRLAAAVTVADSAVLTFGSSDVLLTHSSNALTITGGQLGVGGTPSAWASASAVQVGTYSALWDLGASGAFLTSNTYYDGNNKAINTATAGRAYVTGSAFNVGFAASVSAGSAQTYADKFTVDSGGDIYGPAGATNMTAGFIYVAAGAGAPSGTPTSRSTREPLYVDTTNNRLYFYSHPGGVYKYKTFDNT